MQKNNLAIILSGGTGKRFDISKPKQFYKLNKKTIIETTVEKFVDEKGYEWFPYEPHEDKDRIPLVSDFDKRVYISQSYFAKEYEIPKDYISDKLKPPFNWKTSEIWANYKHLKK